MKPTPDEPSQLELGAETLGRRVVESSFDCSYDRLPKDGITLEQYRRDGGVALRGTTKKEADHFASHKGRQMDNAAGAKPRPVMEAFEGTDGTRQDQDWLGGAMSVIR